MWQDLEKDEKWQVGMVYRDHPKNEQWAPRRGTEWIMLQALPEEEMTFTYRTTVWGWCDARHNESIPFEGYHNTWQKREMTDHEKLHVVKMLLTDSTCAGK